jgi:hypothetical protein
MSGQIHTLAALPRFSFGRKLNGPQSWSGRGGEGKKMWHCRESNSGRPAHNSITSLSYSGSCLSVFVTVLHQLESLYLLFHIMGHKWHTLIIARICELRTMYAVGSDNYVLWIISHLPEVTEESHWNIGEDNVCMCTYVYVCVFMYVCTYVCVCVCVCVCMYVRTYVHTCILTYQNVDTKFIEGDRRPILR